jgi:hypothetical protein
MLSKEESRLVIINNFDKNVLGKYPQESELKLDHKGKIGHWLEKKLGGDIDSDGNADLNGYECKVQSAKTSWGDWGAPYRIFCDKQFKVFNKENSYENMWFLVESLGVKRDHPVEGVYHSMSGKDVPTYINDLTNIGLSLIEKNSDILMTYSFSKDQRHDKDLITPKELKKEGLVIFKWHGTDNSFNAFKNNIISNDLPIDVNLEGPKASVSLEERVRRKFGIHGMVIGLKDKSKGFYGLKFLKSISFNDWLDAFKNKNIIYDTGLTTRNKRPYNQWRSPAKFMKTLEEETYIP